MEHDRQDQERDRDPEDEFGDSWQTYRERTDHSRRTFGWMLPDRSRWHDEEPDHHREDR